MRLLISLAALCSAALLGQTIQSLPGARIKAAENRNIAGLRGIRMNRTEKGFELLNNSTGDIEHLVLRIEKADGTQVAIAYSGASLVLPRGRYREIASHPSTKNITVDLVIFADGTQAGPDPDGYGFLLPIDAAARKRVAALKAEGNVALLQMFADYKLEEDTVRDATHYDRSVDSAAAYWRNYSKMYAKIALEDMRLEAARQGFHQ